jgi:hypothetical protein
MAMRRTRSLALTIFALTLLASGAARADVIDGDWCSPDGRHLSIRGPDIVTPAGTRASGSYSRHAFSYVVPTRDPSPGFTVAMTLVNEETLQFRIGADGNAAAQAPMQIWHRCTTPITWLMAPRGAG